MAEHVYHEVYDELPSSCVALSLSKVGISKPQHVLTCFGFLSTIPAL